MLGPAVCAGVWKSSIDDVVVEQGERFGIVVAEQESAEWVGGCVGEESVGAVLTRGVAGTFADSIDDSLVKKVHHDGAAAAERGLRSSGRLALDDRGDDLRHGLSFRVDTYSAAQLLHVELGALGHAELSSELGQVGEGVTQL